MADEIKKKTKRPTALKRDIRNEKMRMINRSFKSNVRTTVNHFHEVVKSDDKTTLKAKLDALYSVMDRGVKRGIFKRNKASRLKARAMKKFQA